MGSPKWRPGVLGLVANTLAEVHGKPVFLWGREGGDTIRGSARGNGVSVVELMTAAREVFIEFGGHHASGGFSLREENVHGLGAELERAHQTLRPNNVEFREEIELDRELSLSEISFALRDLSKLAPFGVGNKKPLFVFHKASIEGIRTFGKKNEHLEVRLCDIEGGDIAGMSFFSTPDSFTKKLERGVHADIVGHVERDWRGLPRIRIVDAI
jgi:single-stranded-DNA-specific exonuclease